MKKSLFTSGLLAATVLCAIPSLSSANLTPKKGTRVAPGNCRAAVKHKADSTPKGFLLKTIKFKGEEYRYVLYVPADYDASKEWPTIVALNGAGECGRDGLKSVAVGLGPAIMLAPEKWPFLVLIPQKPDVRKQWEDYDDLVMAMLNTTKKQQNVDTTRLYLTGLSQGGHGTWTLGAKHTDLWAAIAPVCAYGDPNLATELKGMPTWFFHGDADKSVPLKQSEDMLEALKKAGGDAKISIYPGVGHNSWDKAYREENLADWFLQHKREKK